MKTILCAGKRMKRGGPEGAVLVHGHFLVGGSLTNIDPERSPGRSNPPFAARLAGRGLGDSASRDRYFVLGG